MGGFFAGLAGGLASGFGERRQRQYQIEHEDRQRRSEAYTHILDNPNATPEAREYALNQIVSIGEGTDGKKLGAKPSPVMQMLRPLLDKIHGGGAQANAAAPSQPAPGGGAIPPPPGYVQPAAGSEGDQPVEGLIGANRAMIQPPAAAPASPGASPGGALPPVPGTASKGGAPAHLFYTPEEIADRQNKAAIARHKALKQADLESLQEAIPAKIQAAEKAKGRPLSASEKQTLINAEFGIHNYGRAQIIRDSDGDQYGFPGQIGAVVRNPVDGSEEFIPTKPKPVKPSAASEGRERMITDYMSAKGVDRPTAEKAVADAAARKNEGTADAAAARPGEVKARTATQGALVNNLNARTAKTGQDSREQFARLEGEKNTKLSSITADYSKRRTAVTSGKLKDDAKQKEIQRLNGEEASQRQLAEDSFQRKVKIVKGEAPGAIAAPPGQAADTLPPEVVAKMKVGSPTIFGNGQVWEKDASGKTKRRPDLEERVKAGK